MSLTSFFDIVNLVNICIIKSNAGMVFDDKFLYNKCD